MTDIASIREKSMEDLKKMSLELVKEQTKLRFQRSTGEMMQTQQFSAIRKTRARIKTVINERGHADE
jgi:large subunit ribosomal protein L29